MIYGDCKQSSSPSTSGIVDLKLLMSVIARSKSEKGKLVSFMDFESVDQTFERN